MRFQCMENVLGCLKGLEVIGQNPFVGSMSLWLLAHYAQNIHTGPFPWVGMRFQCMGNVLRVSQRVGSLIGQNPSVGSMSLWLLAHYAQNIHTWPFPWVGMRFQCMGNVLRVSQRVGNLIGQNPSVEVRACDFWPIVLKIFIQGPSLEWAWGFNAWEMFLGCLKGLETSSVKIHPWEVRACDFWPIVLKIFIHGPSLEWAWGFNAWEMFFRVSQRVGTLIGQNPSVGSMSLWLLAHYAQNIHTGPSLEWAWGFNAWVGMRFQCMGNVLRVSQRVGLQLHRSKSIRGKYELVTFGPLCSKYSYRALPLSGHEVSMHGKCS